MSFLFAFSLERQGKGQTGGEGDGRVLYTNITSAENRDDTGEEKLNYVRI